jgi:tetratricopeptide (TPR) repeat protein
VGCHRASSSRRGRRAIAGPLVASLACLLVSCTVRQPIGGAASPRGPEASRDARLGEANHAARTGEREVARRLYEALLARDARDDEARVGLARVDAWEGELERAERAYRDVLSRHPDDDDVRAGLFDVLAWSGSWEEARRVLDEAGRRESATLLACRARLEYFARGDATEAKRLARRASELAPEDRDLRALKDRIVTGFVRVTPRLLLYPSPLPDLGVVDLAFSQSWGRLALGFETEQGGRPSSQAGGWAYGATYGFSAGWRFGRGFSAGAEAGFGAPAAGVPALRARVTGTAPIGRWFTSSLAYTYRRYSGPVDTHGVSPTLGVVLASELRIDVTYWLTYVRAEGEGDRYEDRVLHTFGIAAGRALLPWLSLRAGYAHGAEAERSPAAFQILDLVSDAFYAGAELAPAGALRLYPLYGLALRGRPGGERLPVHTLELGAAIRW